MIAPMPAVSPRRDEENSAVRGMPPEPLKEVRQGREGFPRGADLAARVAAALGGGGEELGVALAAGSPDPAGFEASVRGGPGLSLTAGRMMVEQAPPALLTAIAKQLDVALPTAAQAWLAHAERERLPLIVGWDRRAGGTGRCVKLYVNASDAAEQTRQRLCAALVPGVALDFEPAVIGMNARADGGVERKLYRQSADAVGLAEGLGTAAQQLAAAARRERADAGGVLSFDVEADGRLTPRAYFVALRESPQAAGWDCVRALPGYDAAAIDALLPFPPAPARSLGIALNGPAWTLYYKPRGSGRAPEALEPAAVFRAAAVEVGIFVEPTEHAARAFRRTARHAVSVRVRAGDPTPRAIEALVDWFTAQLAVADADPRGAAWLANPPPPWQLASEART
jgi:hypothetical protein